jgi:hypothetical protein
MALVGATVTASVAARAGFAGINLGNVSALSVHHFISCVTQTALPSL